MQIAEAIDTITGVLSGYLGDRETLVLLGTLSALLITYWFQYLSARSRRRFELLQHRMREGRELAEEATTLINRRYFGMLRVVWALKEGPQNVEETWKEYYSQVHEWNVRLRSIRIRLRLFSGMEMARMFIDSNDEGAPEPKSIHHCMRELHKQVAAARKAGRFEPEVVAAVDAGIERLGHTIDLFEERLLDQLLYQASVQERV